MSSGVAQADNVGVFSSSKQTVPAVKATGTNSALTVDASSDSGFGVHSQSTSGDGVYGKSSSSNGVYGASASASGFGVFGFNTSGAGVTGESTSGDGVSGQSTNGFGVHATSHSNCGVFASSVLCYGVHAIAGNITPTSPNSLIGVFAEGGPSYGAVGDSTGSKTAGVTGQGTSFGVAGFGPTAGYFSGDVTVTGNLSKAGGSFQIDHPLDPAQKYLFHSFVESPDMKNIYDGLVVLDAYGEAAVTLPAWFDALNTIFRYQLTPIGASGPDLYIAQKIQGNQFKIAGGKAGMEVCWQVTGIRQDAWANAHRIPVEQDKPAQEQGYYLHPELYGESEQKRIERARHL